jgi:hypothetical protein
MAVKKQLQEEEITQEPASLEVHQFENLIEVLNLIDKVKDKIEDLANGRLGEPNMFRLSYELGRSQSDLSRAYTLLDTVTDQLNPHFGAEDLHHDDE